jgi:hypothetical protein
MPMSTFRWGNCCTIFAFGKRAKIEESCCERHRTIIESLGGVFTPNFSNKDCNSSSNGPDIFKSEVGRDRKGEDEACWECHLVAHDAVTLLQATSGASFFPNGISK